MNWLLGHPTTILITFLILVVGVAGFVWVWLDPKKATDIRQKPAIWQKLAGAVVQFGLFVLGVGLTMEVENRHGADDHLAGVCDFLRHLHDREKDKHDMADCEDHLLDQLTKSTIDNGAVMIHYPDDNTLIDATLDRPLLLEYPRVTKVTKNAGHITTEGLSRALTILRPHEYIAEIGKSVRIDKNQKCEDFDPIRRSVGQRFVFRPDSVATRPDSVGSACINVWDKSTDDALLPVNTANITMARIVLQRKPRYTIVLNERGSTSLDQHHKLDSTSFVGPFHGHRLHRWEVEADPGSLWIVRAKSSDDAVLYVIRGDSVWYSDDEGPEKNSFLEFVMPASEKVDILAGTYSDSVNGEYKLYIGRPDKLLLDKAEDSDTLDLRDKFASRYIDSDSGFEDPIRGYRLHRWIVRADAGSHVMVRVESKKFDPVLYVVREDSVLYSDDEGPGDNSFLEFEMPDLGRVDVFAGGNVSGEGGEYRLHVGEPTSFLPNKDSTPPEGELSVGDTVLYRIVSGFEDPVREHLVQRWVVQADSGRSVVVQAESVEFDAVLYMKHGDSVLYSDDEWLGTNSRVKFKMPESGRMDILAGSYSPDARGEYRLHAYYDSPPPPDTLDLTVTDTVLQSRSISSGFVDPIRGQHRVHRWVVQADPGSRVVVQAESDSIDAVLYAVLYLEHGESVLYSDDEWPGTNSILEFKMPDSGRVDVLAGSYLSDATSGEYQLRVYYFAPLLLTRAGDLLFGRLDMPDGVASDSSRIDPGSGFVEPRRGHRLHRWVVRADSGSRVVVRAESNDFDMVLYAVHGDSVLYSDNEGPWTCFRGAISPMYKGGTGCTSTARIASC